MASSELDAVLEAMVGHRVGRLLLINVLALGTYGAVYLAERDGDRALFAVKCLFKTGLQPEHLALQHAEIVLHRQLPPHPHVVPLADAVETDAHLFLVFPYADRGDLFTLIKREPGGIYDKSFARTLWAQLVSAVRHCHAHGVYHRDIKPENVLLAMHKHEWTVQLADFGLATSTPRPTEVGCGSLPYMAPEVVARAPGTTYDAAAADVWSLGIVWFNMLFGVNPWEQAHPTADRHYMRYVANRAAFLGSRDALTPALLALLLAVLEPDPALRLDVVALEDRVAALTDADLSPPRRRATSTAASVSPPLPLPSPSLSPLSAVSIKSHALHPRLAGRDHEVPRAAAAPGGPVSLGLLNVVVGSWADEDLDASMDFAAAGVFRDSGSGSGDEQVPSTSAEHDGVGPMRTTTRAAAAAGKITARTSTGRGDEEGADGEDEDDIFTFEQHAFDDNNNDVDKALATLRLAPAASLLGKVPLSTYED
jgi:serine/threonine protein kinase